MMSEEAPIPDLVSGWPLDSLIGRGSSIAPRRDGLIPRYTRKEMGQVWSEANRFQKWLDVELAATETVGPETSGRLKNCEQWGKSETWEWNQMETPRATAG